MDEMRGDRGRPFRFGEPRQERIYRRLALIGPGPAAFYRDVCRLMTQGSLLESTTHLVAHLLREIESAIRKVLLPYDYVGPAGEQEAKHKPQIEAILRAYGIADTDPVAVGWRKLADQGEDLRPVSLAHRNALAEPRPFDDVFRGFCADVEGIFDMILERFEGQFVASFRILDELLAKPIPTRADVQALRQRVPNNFTSLEYFFSRVSAARWLEVLEEEGFFRRPPAPVRDEERGSIRFSPWPESRYLVWMPAKPELQARVVEIAAAIPETANINVHEDLMGIALAVPAALSAKLIPCHGWLARAGPRGSTSSPRCPGTPCRRGPASPAN